MKKKILYIFFILKTLFCAKWEISKPKKNKFLIIDGLYNPFESYLKKNEITYLFRRGESINLPVVFKCLKELKFNSISYYSNFINFVKPKILLTAFDHYPIFYKLSEKSKIKSIMLQRGKRTWQDGVFKNKEVCNKVNKKDNFVDYVLTHTEKTAKIYSSFIRGNFYSIGSFENNSKKFNNIKKRKEVVYISNIKFDNKNQPMGLNKYDHISIKEIYLLAKKNNLKFNILGRHKGKKANLELNYYNSFLPDDFIFVSKNKYLDSYKTIKKYEFVFSDYSTMGVESLASGSKVGFIFFKPKLKSFFDLRLGKFEGLAVNGPFWSAFSKLKINEIKRVFNFVVNSNNKQWMYNRKKYTSKFMEYDKNNKTFLKIINKIIKNKI